MHVNGKPEKLLCHALNLPFGDAPSNVELVVETKEMFVVEVQIR